MKTLLPVLLVLCLIAPAVATAEWQIETVDSAGNVGDDSALALDSSDKPHISYYDYDYDNLKYARWNDDSSVEFVSLSAEPTDEGVLLNRSIVGDEPAAVSVLRSVDENQPIALSGELDRSATSWLEVTELDGTVNRFGPSEVVVPEAVNELTLSDPYPNPASSALTISYELATDGAVSLSVYDLSGRLVETLVSGEQTAGRHSIGWDSSTSATGVYLLRLEANGEAITKCAVISR